MRTPRRKVRHPGAGINRHKARVGRRLALLGERLRDLSLELDDIGHAFKAGQLRAAGAAADAWSREIALEATP